MEARACPYVVRQDDPLLDSYDVERRRVGELLLRGTDRIFQIGVTSNPVFLFLRNTLVPWVLPWVIKDRSRRAKLFRFMSQLGIRYRKQPHRRFGFQLPWPTTRRRPRP